MSSPRKTIVVIGNGMVGHRLLTTLVEMGATKRFRIVTFCEETRVAYDRVALSSFYGGMSAEDLSLVEAGFFEQSGVELHIGDRAASVDREKKQIVSQKGVTLDYDICVFATGSYPFVPPINGNDAQGCFVYRTIDDLVAIRDWAKSAKRGAVIGGGLLGLEAANALLSLGLETHVVEFAPRLMPVQVDDAGATALRRRIEELAVRVHTSKETRQIGADADKKVQSLIFADGSELPVDMVVFSAGIRARDDLARACGLEIGPRGGIVVNDACRTSDPHIYAIGECALAQGQIWGLVAPGYAMANVVADRIMGGSSEFSGADLSAKLKLLGVEVASFGDAHGRTAGAQDIVFKDLVTNVYKKLVLSADAKHVLGGILIGDASSYGSLVQMMLNRMPVPEKPEDLILPARSEGGGSSALGVGAMPDAAVICSCNNVTKGRISLAIAEKGLTDVGAVKACTKAGTSCGGCATLVGDILRDCLQKAGVEVDNSICEHFKYSRQELFDIVRVNSVSSFGELLARFGKGAGCEISQACRGLDARVAHHHQLHPRRRAGVPSRHQRPLPRQSAKRRQLLDRPSHPGGRDLARQAHRAGYCRARLRALHQDYGRTADRSLRGAGRAAPRSLVSLGRSRLRVRARLCQGPAHGEVLRGQYLVPLRRSRQRRSGDRDRASLPGTTRPSQAQVRRLGVHARMRRSAEQRLRHHRQREGVEPLHLRQRRNEAATRGALRERFSIKRACSATSTDS